MLAGEGPLDALADGSKIAQLEDGVFVFRQKAGVQKGFFTDTGAPALVEFAEADEEDDPHGVLNGERIGEVLGAVIEQEDG